MLKKGNIGVLVNLVSAMIVVAVDEAILVNRKHAQTAAPVSPVKVSPCRMANASQNITYRCMICAWKGLCVARYQRKDYHC